MKQLVNIRLVIEVTEYHADVYYNPKTGERLHCVCPQLISYSLLCKWFRIAVLPADKELYAELYHTEDSKNMGRSIGTNSLLETQAIQYR